jgi:hypothetical protein
MLKISYHVLNEFDFELRRKFSDAPPVHHLNPGLTRFPLRQQFPISIVDKTGTAVVFVYAGGISFRNFFSMTKKNENMPGDNCDVFFHAARFGPC